MAYPTTDWPGSTDAALTRTNLVDIVDADDFNYPDEQIRSLQDWLGDGQGELIGDTGTAADGAGGIVSPVADGGVAFTLAARADFTGGKLLSIVDNYDAAAAELLALSHSGTLTTVGLDLSAGVTVTSILDEDAMGSDSDTALATQQSIKAYVDAAAGGGPGSDTTAIHDDTAAEISAVAAKGAPVSGDYLLIEDSAAADAKKSITIGSIDHDTLTGYVANEHIDWTQAAAGTIHTDNYIEGGPGTDTTAIHDDTAAEISAIAHKANPVNGDYLLIEDSADGDAKKYSTISEVLSLAGGGYWSRTGTIVYPTTDADEMQVRSGSAAAELSTYRTDAHGDDGNAGVDIGYFTFVGEDAGSAETDYARIVGVCMDDAAGSEKGSIDAYIATSASGALARAATVTADGLPGELKIYNTSGADTGDGNDVSYLSFVGFDDAGTPNEQTYARVVGYCADSGSGSEDGQVQFSCALGGVGGAMVTRWAIGATYIEPIGKTDGPVLRWTDGSAAAPSITFSGSLDTGIWHDSGFIKFTTDGSQRATMSVDGVYCDPGYWANKNAIISTSGYADSDTQDGFIFYHLLDENVEFNAPSNPIDGAIITYMIVQPLSSSYTVAWNSIFCGGPSAPSGSGQRGCEVARFMYCSTESKWVLVSSEQCALATA